MPTREVYAIARPSYSLPAQRIGGLGTSQAYMLEYLYRMAPHTDRYNFRLVEQVPPGDTLSDIENAITALIERHETLRTVYPGDSIERSVLEHRQQAVATGTQDIYRYSQDPADALEAAKAMASDLSASPFDLERGPALRAGVTFSKERPAWLVLTLPHVAADAWGVQALQKELSLLLRQSQAARRDLNSRPAWQPIDQWYEESSPAGLTRRNAADRRQAAILAQSVGHAGFGTAHIPQSPRFWEGTSIFGEAGAAAKSLARLCGTPVSAVVLAAAARQLGRVSGAHQATFVYVTSGRHNPRLREAVGCFFRESLVSVVDTGGPFTELIADAGQEVLLAVRHSMASMGTMKDDADADISYYVNFRQSVIPREDQRVSMTSAFSWTCKDTQGSQKYYLKVADLGQALRCSLVGDTQYLPPSAIRDVVLGIPSIIVRAARAQDRGWKSAAEREGLGPAT